MAPTMAETVDTLKALLKGSRIPDEILEYDAPNFLTAVKYPADAGTAMYMSLSTGEQVIVDVIQDLYNGSANVPLPALLRLDRHFRNTVLQALSDAWGDLS